MLSLIYNYLIINFVLLFFTFNINKNFFKIDRNIYLLNLFYHLGITIIYINLFKDGAADYKTYLALTNYEKLSISTFISSELINSIVSIFKYNLLFNDFNLILLFSLISFFGILIFIKNLQKIGVEKKITNLIYLLPGIHFWTCMPGKDSLILFFLSFFFYFYIDRKLIISACFLFFVFLIRPHIGLIFILSIAITEFFILKEYKKKLYIILSTFFLLTIIFNNEIIQSSIININIETDNIFIKILTKLNDFSSKYQYTTTHYENTNILFNVINYILFPIKFLVKNNSLIVNSSILIELISFIFLIFLINKQKKILKLDKKIFFFLSICCLIYLSILPQILFNYGLNVRQKWMIIPFLIYLSFLLKSLYVKINKA